MNEIKPRAPIALSITPKPEVTQPAEDAPRLPRALPTSKVIINTDEDFGDVPSANFEPVMPTRRWPFATVFLSAASALFTLWVSTSLYIWIEGLIAAKPQLGWLAAGLAALTAIALFGFVAREFIAVARLSGNQKLRAALQKAKMENSVEAARIAVSSLVKMAEAAPATARGRSEFSAANHVFLSAAELIETAERDLVAPLDALAMDRLTAAAKRVSLVTAISPRAFVDIAYVLYENARLLRAIAEIYGCRPGFFGSLRLARETLAHLAVTGVVAIGDSLVQQIVGHGMAARVSTKLGEGVLNGLMTARIGFAAMDVIRPVAFSENSRPKITQVLAVLNPMMQKSAVEKT